MTLEAQAAEIQAHKNRLTELEEHVRAREEILVAEAKGAAAAVAASQPVADISRRLSAMEERLRESEGSKHELESHDPCHHCRTEPGRRRSLCTKCPFRVPAAGLRPVR